MIAPETTFRISSKEIAAKVIDGEAIIINLATGIYYSAAEVGAYVWELAEAGHAFDAMTSAVTTRFRAPVGVDVAADLTAFLNQLVEEGLLEAGPAGQVAGPAMHGGSAATYSAPILNAYRDMGDMLALDPPVPGLEPIPWGDPESKR
jgi:hypothetical protein